MVNGCPVLEDIVKKGADDLKPFKLLKLFKHI